VKIVSNCIWKKKNILVKIFGGIYVLGKTKIHILDNILLESLIIYQLTGGRHRAIRANGDMNISLYIT